MTIRRKLISLGDDAIARTYYLVRRDSGYSVEWETEGYMQRIVDPRTIYGCKLPEEWDSLPPPVQEKIRRSRPWLASKCEGITFDETGRRYINGIAG